MKHPVAPSALDRLREAFRPPQSFGTAAGASQAPPAASMRVSPDAPDPGAATAGTAETHWNEGAGDTDAVWAESGVRARRIRVDPGLPGIRVLALAGLLAALLAGVYLWWSRPEARPVPQPSVRPAARPAVAPATSPAGPSPPPTPLMVDVAGKVRHPGVVSLTSGARVIDAIKEAGGLRPGTRTGTLNLARRVVDGEQILVGIKAPPAAAPPADPSASPGATVPGAPIDLNAATAAQLDQLPGVGPVLAQRIVDYRTQHGGFHSVDELRQVSGIGPAKFADLKDLVRV